MAKNSIEKNSKRQKRAEQHKRQKDDLEEERRLTAMLFGESSASQEMEMNGIMREEELVPPTALFQLDHHGEQEESDNDDAAIEESDVAHNSEGPAWMDDDDDDIRVDLTKGASRLRKLRHNKSETVVSNYKERLTDIHSRMGSGLSSWARLPNGTQTSSSASSLLAQGPKKLAAHIVDITRCRDANESDPSQTAVQSVEFFPQSPNLLLTAGLDKSLRFFQLSQNEDGVESTKLHGIHFPRLPIYSAHFLGISGKVVVSGRRPFYYVCDVATGELECIPTKGERSLEKCVVSPCGSYIAFLAKDGYIWVVESRNYQLVEKYKINGTVRAVCFHGNQLWASGSDGIVYQFDQTQGRTAVSTFENEDGTITSGLAVHPNGQTIAVGAESGVINLYDTSSRSKTKSIFNLTTSVDGLKYHEEGDMLALYSKRDRGAFKLFHTSSQSVFSNWPTSKTPLSYPWSLDFSSNFLAIGNDKGKCLLYQLNHYHRQQQNE